MLGLWLFSLTHILGGYSCENTLKLNKETLLIIVCAKRPKNYQLGNWFQADWEE